MPPEGALEPRPEGPGAWFPVIDYDRCTGCGACLSFCLFGVYGREGAIQVLRPDACKPHCPACARVCPERAILFPKYPSGPISGAPVRPGEEPGLQVDVSAMLGGDAYAALRQRRGKRFQADPARAAARQQRLRELQAQLGVPEEVVEAWRREGRV